MAVVLCCRPIASMALVTSYLMPRVLFAKESSVLPVADLCVSMAAIAGIAPTVMKGATRGILKYQCSKHINTIRKAVQTIKIFKKMSKKSIRLIQEMELVARGFTLYVVHILSYTKC